MKDKVVAITGAGSGIGRATALACARRGARVAALDIDLAAAQTVAREAVSAGAPAAAAIACDVGAEQSVTEAFDCVVADLGVPTGVFANAGIEVNAPLDEMSLEQWEAVVGVNLTGVFLTCKHALRHLIAAQLPGSLVCTSSPAAFVGFAGGGNGAYASSKGGISALVRSTALDYAGRGIRVNAVVPGATDTPMLRVGDGAHGQAAEALKDAAREQIPVGRLADPDEIAAAVVWLLSDDSSYVTGSNLVCDGGLMAKSANTF